MHHLVDPHLRVHRLLVPQALRQAATCAMFHDQRKLLLMPEVVMKGDNARQVQPSKRPHLYQKFLVLTRVCSVQKFDGDMVVAQHGEDQLQSVMWSRRLLPVLT